MNLKTALKKRDVETMDEAPQTHAARKGKTASKRKRLPSHINLAPFGGQQTENEKENELLVTVDLGRLPRDIGCHAPNGKIELCSDDAPDILSWIDRKIGTAHNAYIIVSVVSWCPSWLAMQISAHLALNQNVHELRCYFQGVQHDIFDPTGVIGANFHGVHA